MKFPLNHCLTAFLMTGLLILPPIIHGAESESSEKTAAAPEQTELDAIGVRDKLARLPGAERARGKTVPGKVRTDVYAKLQINGDLREFLDFFVNLAEGPEDQAAVEDLMMTVLERRGMRGHIRVQVLEVLRDYMPYRMAVVDQGLESLDSEELWALREKHLGEEQARMLFR